MFHLAVEDFWLNNWPLPSKFFLHATTSSVAGTLPSSKITTSAVNASTGANINRAMNANVGTSQASLGDTSWTTNGTGALTAYEWISRHVSSELATQTIPSGNWTFSFAMQETSSANSGGTYVNLTLAVWRPSSGSLVATLINNTGFISSSSPGAESAFMGTVAGSSQAILNGDVLVLEVLAGGTSDIVNQPASGTEVLYFDGTTQGSSTTNAAYLLAPGTLTFGTSAVSSTIRLLPLLGVGV